MQGYFELKYSIQSKAAIVTLILAIITILGYGTYENIENSISKPTKIVDKKFDSINMVIESYMDSMHVVIDSYFENLSKFNEQYSYLKNSLDDLSDQAEWSDTKYSDLFIQLDMLRSEVMSELNYGHIKSIYIRDSVNLNPSGLEPGLLYTTLQKIYFNRLWDSNFEIVPSFKKPPIVLLNTARFGSHIVIKEVTNEYFTFVYYSEYNSNLGQLLIIPSD
ncbi:MAG: hypothetical protein R2759_11120 [Bacteroidales bacterium]